MAKLFNNNIKKETVKVVDLKKANEIKPRRRKNTVKLPTSKKSITKKKKIEFVEEEKPTVYKIFEHPVYKNKSGFLNKLKAKLNEYFNCIPEDLKNMKVSEVIEELKRNKVITVSIGDCSYIFEGGDFKDKDKIKNKKVKNILSTLAKNLRNL